MRTLAPALPAGTLVLMSCAPSASRSTSNSAPAGRVTLLRSTPRMSPMAAVKEMRATWPGLVKLRSVLPPGASVPLMSFHTPSVRLPAPLFEVTRTP
jgi:hypothetical protein